jgi:hypothetical protein
MASYNVVCYKLVIPSPVDGGSDTIEYRFVPGQVSYLEAGDTINFYSEGGETFKFSGFDSDKWTNTSEITGSGTKTIKSGVSDGAKDYIVAKNTSGVYRDTFTADFTVADEMPNPLGLTDITNVDPKGVVQQSFKVQGINKAVKVRVSGTGSRFVYLRSSTSPLDKAEFWASNGESFSVVAEAEYDYEEMSRTITVTAGKRTESFKVVTRKWPLPEQVINLDISPPQDLYLKKHIATFFGGSPQPLLTDYLRGNFLVPSIEQNAHVPKSPPIYISDLYNTASALYFIYKPPDKSDSANTLNGGKNLELVWNVVDDYTVGYGELSRYVDYRYTFTSDDSELTNINGGDPDDVTLHSTTGSPGTWSQSNSACWLKVSAPQNTERWYKGTLTIYARNAIDTSLVISKTVQWSMFFFGP